MGAGGLPLARPDCSRAHSPSKPMLKEAKGPVDGSGPCDDPLEYSAKMFCEPAEEEKSNPLTIQVPVAGQPESRFDMMMPGVIRSSLQIMWHDRERSSHAICDIFIIQRRHLNHRKAYISMEAYPCPSFRSLIWGKGHPWSR
jgi:hypothetical protein